MFSKICWSGLVDSPRREVVPHSLVSWLRSRLNWFYADEII